MRRVYLCEGPYGDVWNIVVFGANANVTSVERDCEVGVIEDQTDDYDGVDLTCPHSLGRNHRERVSSAPRGSLRSDRPLGGFSVLVGSSH